MAVENTGCVDGASRLLPGVACCKTLRGCVEPFYRRFVNKITLVDTAALYAYYRPI
jgi:hypothetical protein